MRSFRSAVAFVVMALVGTACVVEPPKTDTSGGPATTKGTDGATASDGTTGPGGTNTSTSGGPGTSSSVPDGKQTKLVVGGEGLKLKLNTKDAPVIAVPEDTGAEKRGYIVSVDLRQEEEVTLTACPDDGSTASPQLAITPADAPTISPLEGSEAEGGFVTAGQFLTMNASENRTFLIHVFDETKDLKATDGAITLRAVAGGEKRCPGPRK